MAHYLSIAEGFTTDTLPRLGVNQAFARTRDRKYHPAAEAEEMPYLRQESLACARTGLHFQVWLWAAWDLFE